MMQIARYMTADPVTVRPETPLSEVRDILHARGFRHLPVTDAGGVLQGMVSDRDIRSALPSTMLDGRERTEELDHLARVPASSFMSRTLLCLPRHATLDDALLLFDTRKVGALPVVDAGGRVVGIFSTRDLMRAYRTLFGLGEPGSALVEVSDDGAPHLVARIAALLDGDDVPCTRLVRVPAGEDRRGVVYVRVQTYNLHGVRETLRRAGLETIIEPRPPDGGARVGGGSA